MPRLRRLLLTCLIIYAFPNIGLSQTPGQESATLARQNPVLASLNQVAPESTPAVMIRLKRIGDNRPLDTPKRGNTEPTPTEFAQLKANPAFEEAYNRQPAEALHLLRDVNNILRKAGR